MVDGGGPPLTPYGIEYIVDNSLNDKGSFPLVGELVLTRHLLDNELSHRLLLLGQPGVMIAALLFSSCLEFVAR